MRRFKWLSYLVCSTLACLMLFAGSPVLAAEKGANVIRVGALLELSGGAAAWGIATLRGWEIMTDKINAMGGIKVGGKQYQLELVKADNKSNVDTSLSQANKMIFNENLKFIMGPIISGSVLAILPVTEKNKVILCSMPFTPKILGPDKPYSFRLYASGNERMPLIYSYLKKNRPDIKSIALIGPNDETGWGSSKFAAAAAKEAGYTVTVEEFVQRGTTDFFPALTKLIATKPACMIPHSMPPGETALVLQQAYQLGYRGLVISPSHYDPAALVAKAGADAVEGFIFQSADFNGASITPAMRELAKKYQEQYKEPIDPIANAGYAYLWVLKMAMEKANSFDTTAVAHAMETLEGEGPFGHFSMGGLKTYGIKHQISEPVFFSIIRKGKQMDLGSYLAVSP